MVKHALHIWLLLFIALLVVACAEPAAPTPTPTVPPPENPLVGKWAPTSGEALAFEFFKGGTMILTSDGRQFSGTYEMPQSDQVRMLLSGDLGAREYLLTNVKVSGDKLSFVLDGTAGEMVRVQASS